MIAMYALECYYTWNVVCKTRQGYFLDRCRPSLWDILKPKISWIQIWSSCRPSRRETDASVIREVAPDKEGLFNVPTQKIMKKILENLCIDKIKNQLYMKKINQILRRNFDRFLRIKKLETLTIAIQFGEHYDGTIYKSQFVKRLWM